MEDGTTFMKVTRQTMLPDGEGFASLDGTWSHDNGSDQWDGSAIGGDFGDGKTDPAEP